MDVLSSSSSTACITKEADEVAWICQWSQKRRRHQKCVIRQFLPQTGLGFQTSPWIKDKKSYLFSVHAALLCWDHQHKFQNGLFYDNWVWSYFGWPNLHLFVVVQQWHTINILPNSFKPKHQNQSCKNVPTVPTSQCYFFWPVLIFGKSTRKTGRLSCNQAA